MKQELLSEENTTTQSKTDKLKSIWESIKSAENLKGPARLLNESDEDFYNRRFIENTWTKSRLKGKFAWLSTNLEWDKESQDSKTLYIGKFDDFGSTARILKTIHRPDGSIAFIIATGTK